MDERETLTMIRLMVMDRPLCEVMPQVPGSLLEELISTNDAAATFGMYYQEADPNVPVAVENLDTWRKNVQRCANLEQLRRKGWAVKAWPRDFADETFWNEVKCFPKRQTVELRAA